MMRAKTDPKVTTNSFYGLAAILLAGSLLGLVVPKPSAKQSVQKEQADTRKLNQSTKQAVIDMNVAKASVLTRTWTGTPSSVQEQIYSLTTTLAKKRGLSFVRLQPQRVTPGGAIEQLPFLLVVEGPFPAVAALEKDLELPANRVAVNLFQISSSDSETNKVTANIGLVAHHLPTVVETKESNAKRP